MPVFWRCLAALWVVRRREAQSIHPAAHPVFLDVLRKFVIFIGFSLGAIHKLHYCTMISLSTYLTISGVLYDLSLLKNFSNESKADLGTSIDLKSADKELKAVTPGKAKLVSPPLPKSW